ncbi:hypothetical protein SDRG_09616 [Saprolegnia diclina VS20]|uniref:protein-serine/threonine phosphatase n=1 Tax=Saprolegnia diclina (strain VS20) TaxID=1156394 RepID=T0QG94_SAPDV|nr:hypothetical protein SDRG_09616 [Saprolegnia diclina VS20]EQC32640.1 hypothetical protein SDRG_09616 [Saprolegnia diclina VS20]|eukprot:XP_008613784.1 hypothetical protein SDRG_09616 [Saprolegnia diclina VS20]
MADEEAKAAPIALVGKWKKEEIRLDVGPSMTILDVKLRIQAITGIQPARQKLVGLNVRGKPASDNVRLGDMALKHPQKFMLIGTKDSEVLVDPDALPAGALPPVFSDFNCAFAQNSAQWHSAKENNLALARSIAMTHIHVMHPPRPSKKLLVLDLDHTLMDISATKDNGIPSSRFMRPYMHTFLSAVWSHFDVCIWSQTSWKWIEIKLTELGMLTTPDYRINFILDKTNMFSYQSIDDSKTKKRKSKVKALEIIWSHFPGVWHARNTVHVDDLPHNFNLNPRNGIPIARYDCTDEAATRDAELLHLATYLQSVVAPSDDVTSLDLASWRNHDALK